MCHWTEMAIREPAIFTHYEFIEACQRWSALATLSIAGMIAICAVCKGHFVLFNRMHEIQFCTLVIGLWLHSTHLTAITHRDAIWWAFAQRRTCLTVFADLRNLHTVIWMAFIHLRTFKIGAVIVTFPYRTNRIQFAVVRAFGSYTFAATLIFTLDQLELLQIARINMPVDSGLWI